MRPALFCFCFWTGVRAIVFLAFGLTSLFASHICAAVPPLLRAPVLPSPPRAMPYLYGSPYYSSYAYPYSYGAYSYPYSSYSYGYSYPYSYGYGYGYPYSRYYW